MGLFSKARIFFANYIAHFLYIQHFSWVVSSPLFTSGALKGLELNNMIVCPSLRVRPYAKRAFDQLGPFPSKFYFQVFFPFCLSIFQGGRKTRSEEKVVEREERERWDLSGMGEQFICHFNNYFAVKEKS